MQIQTISYLQVSCHLWLVTILLAAVHLGCDRNEPSIPNPRSTAANERVAGSTSVQPGAFVNHSTPANSIISNCIQRYRDLRSYQDQATIELQYELNGEPIVDKAPLNVAWDRSGKLGLKVYSLIAGPSNSGRWHLKVMGTRQDLIGQILSRHPPDKLSFDWLLTEPIVREELSIGLAGFPPQLDLLLSSDPLSGLLQNATSVTLGTKVSIDQRNCDCVVVALQHLVYELYVDEQSKLLRRIVLPVQSLPPALLAQTNASTLKLIINFHRIQTNHAIAWSEFQIPIDPGDLELSRFVPRPPEISTEGYGKTTPAFQLRRPDGEIGYDSRPSNNRRVSVLIWLADHPSCRIAAEQSTRALQDLLDQGLTAEEVEFVSVWAEPNPPSGLSFDQLKSEWRLPGQLVLDHSAAGRDLFGVQEAPTVVVLDGQGLLQLRDARTNPLLEVALPSLINRIASGESLADEIQQAKINAQSRFRAELEMAAIDVPRLPAASLREYLPQHVKLTETGRESYSGKLTYLFQDAHDVPWVLMDDGILSRLSSTLAVEKSYPTSLCKSNEHVVQISFSSDSRLVACLADNTQSQVQNVNILDTRTGQETQVALPDNCRIADLSWLIDSNSHHLAIVTDSGDLIVFDWATQQRLIGRCPQKPIAIIGPACSVVLEDGTIEPIDMDSGLANRTVKPISNSASAGNSDESRLPFKPLPGIWVSSRTQNVKQSIATGLLEKAEPALFFLDSRMEVTGHFRLPVRFSLAPFKTKVACAESPGNGQLMCAVLEENGTVHLIRGDSGWSDHLLLENQNVGICLIPSGDRLKLILATRDEVVSYQLD